MATTPLASTPVVKIKDEKSIVAHFSSGTLLHFSREETLINGFDNPEGVYLITKGFVKACSVSRVGHRNLLLVHGPGEFIPLPWALNGTQPTGLSYIAMSDVTVLRISKDKLRQAIITDNQLAQETLQRAVAIITVYTQRIQTLEFRSARGRIIAELLCLSERFGTLQDKGVFIDAPITHQDIADSINMTRETASRALELLFKQKLLSQTDHQFTILDLPRLRTALI